MNFIEHLSLYLPEKEISALLEALKSSSYHALLLNTEKLDKESFINEFKGLKEDLRVPNLFYYDANQYAFGKHYLFELGAYYLFEPCSSLVSYLLNPTKDDLVLDLCAAPGGKTIHTSLMMENDGLIVANEINLSRAYILSSNVERMGRRNVIVTNNTVEELVKTYPNTFTKIILDAPCSGSGMFRKEKKMEDDWTYEKVLRLSSLQKELILMAYQMLKPGGTMVYSTCSYSYQEDEDIIKHLLENESGAEIIPIEESEEFYSSDLKGTIHLFPHRFKGEGHFIALIRKEGELKYTRPHLSSFSKLPFEIKELNLQGDFFVKDNTFYHVPYLIKTNKLHLIRYGLKLGTQEKQYFDYDFALARYLDTYPRLIQINEEQLRLYLRGETLKMPSEDGINLLKYHNLSVAFTKVKNQLAKNHYPKGLRKRF